VEDSHGARGMYSVGITALSPDEDDEDTDDTTDGTTGGGGGGGRPGDGGYHIGGIISGGYAYAELDISEKYLELNAGEEFSLIAKVQGSGGDYSMQVDADFGTVEVKPSERYVYPDEKASFYLDGEVDNNAEGRYVMKINLLYNGEIVDTERVYVTVGGGFETLELIGLILLVLVALGGVAAMCYLIIRRRGGGQIDLRRYY
jgi:hypothetical protein